MAQLALPSWLGPFQARPRLVLAFVGGTLFGLACRFWLGLLPSSSVILGWDAVCLGFIVSMLWTMAESSLDDMRARAEQDDEGRLTILTLVLVAAVAAILAIAMELSLAKSAHGLVRGLRVALAFATVAASWFMVHLIFALHYAHGYYDRDEASATDARGLRFPGEEEPDYWDFLHFAVIIGVASQTADIAISAKRLRRLNTVHALFSFAFNTVVVALTINLLAGLF
ncbi:MAG: putative rane protein [Phenylobacterium sp.]|nr:putative rane protein [Phenylobacterium sp.]